MVVALSRSYCPQDVDHGDIEEIVNGNDSVITGLDFGVNFCNALLNFFMDYTLQANFAEAPVTEVSKCESSLHPPEFPVNKQNS